MSLPEVPDLLRIAVASVGGSKRSGQLTMASAVAHAIDSKEHLAVQAGTGTGKSLAYLVPAIRHACQSGTSVIVSTATIALQTQLVDRDLPRLAKALTPALKTEPTFAILKGRGNYLCLNKLHSSMAQDQESAELFDPFAASRMGREIKRLREWSSETETGDRDELTPGVSDGAWRQLSVSARECLGASRCPYGEDCFAEKARAQASQVNIIVTNHALLAIDAMTEVNVLPEHDVVIVDEAHELADRVTSVATQEISPGIVTSAARRASKLVDTELVDNVIGAAENFERLLDEVRPGEWTEMPGGAGQALAAIRDQLWLLHNAIGPADKADPDAAAARSAARTAITDVHDCAVRILTAFAEKNPAKRKDVVWLSEIDNRNGTSRRSILVAPLSIGGLLSSTLFEDSSVVLTSATLTIGGNFDQLAAQWGLPPHSEGWNGLDVGSPFDHRKAGILYVAKHLPPPGRDAISSRTLDDMTMLISAAGGRTLGLFSSIRAAKEAAAALKERIQTPILCQGEDTTGSLVKRFAEDEPTSLFGTLSLWQGVDVPGRSLSVVMIDRIPFPRPDDPLLNARQRAVEARGGNGFLSVSASHAALLLAQGVGRLLRSTDDKGVVAMLDPRIATARYGGFIRASLPPFWETTDRTQVTQALQRLTACE